MNIKNNKILILDFGSQFTQLIARRVREAGVYCEVWPWDVDFGLVTELNPKGIILSGGPESVHLEDGPPLDGRIFGLEIPILGICYGMQAIAHHFGGTVMPSAEKEFGYAQVKLTNQSVLLDNIYDIQDKDGYSLDVWMSHNDKVELLPEDFYITAQTATAPIASFENTAKTIFGVQFHIEVEHTKQGKEIFKRFLFEICQCEKLWQTDNIIATHVENIKQLVASDKVLLGLSGGVDSSVVAALLHQGIGDNLICVFVDTGLLRYQEGNQVMQTMAEGMNINVIRVNAQQRYYAALTGEADPEKKRKIIGGLFIKIFEEQARKLGNIKWLAQGTIYPDVIESAASETGKSHVIKSHHNVGGLPVDMNLQLLEPLRDLFKDEVRKIGVALGLPKAMVYRHPFPGPGLGVRILGEVKPQYVTILAKADYIFITELVKWNLYDKTSQAFAVFLPVKSVGVVGDVRRYEYVISLRAVETVDFMTAKWAHLPY
ncbi:GMP synthase [glutamine-hydrolyzing], amidotransferase subunit / GMP synthase [glutamine-hydrolyzing], ATP pyrophosphatase subunit, partial [hydrothermal vent metagenome]